MTNLEKIKVQSRQKEAAAMANFEKIKALAKQEEARLAQLRAKRVEREEKEQHEEEEQRSYDEQTQRWENRRKEIAWQVALEYKQIDQNLSNFQREYFPSIAALNAALKINQAPVPVPPLLTSAFQAPKVVPNLV